jgi:intein/homing endonuclease
MFNMENIKLLKGKTLYTMSCLSGRRLGVEHWRNGGVFWGYCVKGDTYVVTNPEIKPISKVTVGESVLTDDGRFSKILNVFSRPYKGEIIKITPSNYGVPVELTPEHPVLVIKRKMHGNYTLRPYPSMMKRKGYKKLVNKAFIPTWVKASEVEKGDFLILPLPRETQDIDSIRINEHLENILVKDGWAIPLQPHYKNGSLVRRACNPIRNEIKIDEHFLRLCGYYISEGCIYYKNGHPKAIRFDFGKDQQEYADDIVQIVKRYGLRGIVKVRQNTIQVFVYSSLLSRLFIKFFGVGAHKKKLPDWIMKLPKFKVEALLEGLRRGDGCLCGQRNIYYTVSDVLARQLFLLLVRNGYEPVLQKGRNSGKGKYIYRIEFEVKLKQHKCIRWNGNLLIPVRKIEKENYEGIVYNLEVDERHTFVTECFITHNCDVFAFVIDEEELFKEAANHGLIVRETLKLPWSRCFEEARRKFDELVKKAKTFWAKVCLIHDKESLVCYDSSKPTPQCFLRRKLFRIVGWRPKHKIVGTILEWFGLGVLMHDFCHQLYVAEGLRGILSLQGGYVGFLIFTAGYIIEKKLYD